MAVSSKVGRPYHVADIDFRHDPDQELYDEFYNACRKLTYCDMRLLGKAFGFHWRTVWGWKAGKSFPTRKGIARQLINWVNTGKPQKTVTQAEAADTVFYK